MNDSSAPVHFCSGEHRPAFLKEPERRMSVNRYEEILRRAQEELTPQEQEDLSEALAQRAGVRKGGHYRITDLKGTGKEIWKDIDVDEYVAKERDSWTG